MPWGLVKRFATDRLADVTNAADAFGNEVEYRAKQLNNAKDTVTNSVVDKLQSGAAQLRDEAIVPAIDNAMESGSLPSDVGMFGRYLTGTSVPLTKVPADIKRDEQIVADRLGGAENNNARRQEQAHLADAIAKSDAMTNDFNTVKRVFDEQQNLGVNIKAHNLGLETYSPDQISQYDSKEQQIEQLKQKYGGRITPLTTSNPAEVFTDSQRNYAASEFVPFDKNNYDNSGYRNESGRDPFVGATTNTLGQYSVKDGTAIDRYDFNRYKKGNFQTGVIVGSHTKGNLIDSLADTAGGIADKLGIITPESGYDVRLKLR